MSVGRRLCVGRWASRRGSIDAAAALIEQKETSEAFELLGHRLLTEDPDNIEHIEDVLSVSREQAARLCRDIGAGRGHSPEQPRRLRAYFRACRAAR